mmetsp:Transcript_12395/g.21255  ORF Transcript_12395/g.21255 Transcript_12395/m.21255 type:complete len:161 (+) Transcript_12395:204-686(+)
MLPTIGRHGMTFEVGAVSWGCVDGALFQQSLSLLGHLFDYVEAHNRAVEAGVFAAWQPRSLPVYDAARTVNYPRYDDGTIAATPHPAIQGQDFTVVRAGEPVFLTNGGQGRRFRAGGGREPGLLPLLHQRGRVLREGRRLHGRPPLGAGGAHAGERGRRG